MTDLNGKVVLVTGSSRGIGAEIAVAFARQGAKVVLHGRDTEALVKVQADITNGGGQAMLSPAMSRSSPTSRPCGRGWSRRTV